MAHRFIRKFFLCIASLQLVGSVEAIGTWTAPTAFSLPSSSFPDVAVDANGQALSTYSTVGVLLSNTLPANSQVWSIPTTLGDDGEIPIDTLQRVAMDASGYAVAVWSSGAGGGAIHGAVFNGGIWSATTLLATSAGNEPHVALDTAGNAYAVWYQLIAGDLRVRAAQLTFGSLVWSSATNLSIAGTDAQFPEVTAGPAGTAVAIWQFGAGIQATTFSGGTWSASVANIAVDGTTPVIKSDSSGDAVAAWASSSGIQAATLPFGGLWSSVSTISSPGATDPDIAVDPIGNAVAIWEVGGVVQAATLASGSSTWSSPLNLGSSSGSGSCPRVVMDASGNAYAVWADSSNMIDFSALALNGSSWTAPTILSSPGSSNAFPDIGISPSAERAVVVWENDTNGFIEAAIGTNFTPSAQPLPPSNLKGTVIKNKFLTETDRIHKLTWTASPDSTVAGYHIYRDGKLIATIPAAGPFTYSDHNRSKKKSNTYIVTAFNSAGIESTGLTITLR